VYVGAVVEPAAVAAFDAVVEMALPYGSTARTR
jgi:hypothetical protein